MKVAEGTVVFVEFPDPPGDFTDAERKSLAALRKMLQRPLNDAIEASLEAVKKKLMRFHHRPLAFACEMLDVDDKKVFLDEEARVLHSKATCSDDLLCWVHYFFLCSSSLFLTPGQSVLIRSSSVMWAPIRQRGLDKS